MKIPTTTLPPLRVNAELRQRAEAALAEGETLSSFMLESITLNIERRKLHDEFVARGLASEAKARKTGRYIAAEQVFRKLRRRLSRARAAK